MTTVKELQQAILGLSDAEYTELIRWPGEAESFCQPRLA